MPRSGIILMVINPPQSKIQILSDKQGGIGSNFYSLCYEPTRDQTPNLPGCVLTSREVEEGARVNGHPQSHTRERLLINRVLLDRHLHRRTAMEHGVQRGGLSTTPRRASVLLGDEREESIKLIWIFLLCYFTDKAVLLTVTLALGRNPGS